ncbi:peptidyl-prolyl cis-trans isomerase FKBP3-like [Stigmatopora argus]
MADEPVWESTAEQLRSGVLPKKDLIKSLQDDAAHSFLNEHRLLRNIKNVGKNGQNGAACPSHIELFVSKRFKATETVEEVTKQLKAVQNQ